MIANRLRPMANIWNKTGTLASGRNLNRSANRLDSVRYAGAALLQNAPIVRGVDERFRLSQNGTPKFG